jgi:hypothetical protein
MGIGGAHGDGPFVVPRGHGHWGGPLGWALGGPMGMGLLSCRGAMGVGGSHWDGPWGGVHEDVSRLDFVFLTSGKAMRGPPWPASCLEFGRWITRA